MIEDKRTFTGRKFKTEIGEGFVGKSNDGSFLIKAGSHDGKVDAGIAMSREAAEHVASELNRLLKASTFPEIIWKLVSETVATDILPDTPKDSE